MKKSLPILLAVAMLAGCTTVNPYTGEQQTSKLVWGTALGTAAGAATGALVDKNHGRGALIGAATGAAVGGGVGYYLDTQEAELRAELESTGVRVVRDSDSIRLVMPGNITFNSDSADINSGFYPVLNSVAKVLNKYSNSTVMVMGYTDSTGTVAYNQTLSQQRAQSVASYLMGQGVKSSRFEVMGMGISNPIASNSTAAGRAQNRRVEIKIVPNK
ncbi:MAG: OmpA family protein [Alphaproteobacteria bacterium]|nr:OmpA family protein [Alphaproteobacteria bacterium]